MTKKIVVVGGVAAGATAAAKARRTDEFAEITLIEKGPYVSYANCGLPYHLGGIIEEREKLLLHSPKSFGDRFNAKVLVNTEAVDINTKEKYITVIEGQSRKNISYDKLIIANGGKPFIPPVNGLEKTKYFMLRTVEDMDSMIEFIHENRPKSALIIGGGYIGIETAEALANCNLKVTIIEALDHILPGFDPEISLKISEAMESAGIDVITGRMVTDCYKAEKNNRITLDDGTTLETDILVVSTGTKPDTKLAEKAGIKLGELGGITVNEKMETSVKDIYAAGDVAEKFNIVSGKNCLLPLAGPANKEGRAAGSNAAGGNLTFKGVVGTSVVSFGESCVARTGLDMDSAEKCGYEPDFVYVENSDSAEYYPDPKFIFLKIFFDKMTGKVLGAQASGSEGVTRRVDVISTAVYSGLSVEDLEQLEFCYSPPHGAAKDIVNMGGYVSSNLYRGECFSIKPSCLLKYLDSYKGSVILDVRTSVEYRSYHFEDALHVPLEKLRKQMHKIDKNKNIYVYCAVGFRGYLAVKILRQYGYKAFNILGGLEAILRFAKL